MKLKRLSIVDKSVNKRLSIVVSSIDNENDIKNTSINNKNVKPNIAKARARRNSTMFQRLSLRLSIDMESVAERLSFVDNKNVIPNIIKAHADQLSCRKSAIELYKSGNGYRHIAFEEAVKKEQKERENLMHIAEEKPDEYVELIMRALEDGLAHPDAVMHEVLTSLLSNAEAEKIFKDYDEIKWYQAQISVLKEAIMVTIQSIDQLPSNGASFLTVMNLMEELESYAVKQGELKNEIRSLKTVDEKVKGDLLAQIDGTDQVVKRASLVYVENVKRVSML